MFHCKWLVSLMILIVLLVSGCQPVVMPDAGVSVQPEAAPPELSEKGSLAEVNHIRVYYEVRGEGEPLLLMPGDMRTTEDVADLVELLAPAYQVVVMDARGRGRSTDSEQPLTMAIMADDAVALMDELGIDKAHIVSWASSAGVALEMAMRYPERVDKLVTYAPNYTVDGLAPDHLAWFKSLTVEDMVPMFEEQYSRTAPDPDYLPVILDRLQELILREPNYTPEMLSQIQAPTLVLDGDLDDWIVREHLEGMAEAIPSAELVFLPDLDHFAPFENPVAWTNAVLSFLAQPTEITKAAETVPRF